MGLLSAKIAKLESETKHLSEERFRLISEIDKISREHLSEKLRLLEEHSKEVDRIIDCLTDKT